MQFDLAHFRAVFFEESGENLALMESGLLELENAPGDDGLLNSIFRAAHSIKGGSGTFGLDALGHFTHSVENLLERMRQHELPVTRERIGLLLRSRDMMQALFDAARSGGSAPEDVESLVRELEADLAGLAGHPAKPTSAAGPTPQGKRRVHVRFAPNEEIFFTGSDVLLLLADLAATGSSVQCELDVAALPSFEALDPERCYLAWNVTLESEASLAAMRSVFEFVEDNVTLEFREDAPATAQAQGDQAHEATSQAPAPQGPPKGIERRRSSGADSTSIRVPVEKVDGLIDLVGELVIAQSMVSALVQEFKPERLAQLRDAVNAMRRNTRELQGRVMSVRMVPVGSVFGRFPRLVRDLSSSLGKEIELVLSGEDTELDKSVVEQISDPLTHMIRNCADHGIETPDVRRAAGKCAHGTIRLSASAQNGNVVIEVTDDGRGLDGQRIRAKAEERGLITPGQELSETEMQELIFLPGFSTAAKVTDLSGRGVGLDVVKSSVTSLGGLVQIESRFGQGTTMRLKLPLTLAILDGLLLRVGRQTFVLALTSILETLRPIVRDLKTVFGRGEVVMVRGKPVPLLRLHRLLNVQTERTRPEDAMLILVEHEGKRLALLADELLGQQEVVIKSIDSSICKVDGVLGATILGDGRVAMILDVSGLARLSSAGEPESAAALQTGAA
jgi:two-component system chemotaxis sensor kinase CheA